MIKKIILSIVMIGIMCLVGFGVYEKQMGILNSEGKKSILEALHYDVAIQPDGSALIEEYRTYQFIKGEFSRGFLDIEGQADQISVSEEGGPYQLIAAFDENRPEGCFAVEPSGANTRVEWYYKVNTKQSKTFKIQYRVFKTAQLYNDCVDYFQKYVSSANSYKIKNLSVLVKLPEGANKDNTKIWAHGPSGGKIEFNNQTTVELKMKNVPPREYIEARFLMPVTVMPPTDQKISVDRFNELYDMENKAAEESQKERRMNGIVNLICILLTAIIIFMPILSIGKYKVKLKRLKPEMEPKYYRDLPSDIYPAELDYLMNHYSEKENTSVQISATLLDLINKGSIYAQVIEESTTFGKKSDTLFSNLLAKWDGIAAHEKALLEFFFIKVGDGSGKVSLKAIKKYCSNKKTGQEAYKFYLDFQQKVQKKVNGRDYFENKRNKLPKSFNRYIILYIVLMVVPMILMNKVEGLSDAPVYFISIGSFIGFMSVALFGGKTKRLLTQTGENQFALWNAFKNFLSDFTTFDRKELPELFMWEKYLVYATVLGVAQKLLKQLYAKYPEIMNVNEDSRLFYWMNDGNNLGNYERFNDLGNAIQGAMRDTINIASKAASKGSGGDFSSGGSDAGSGAGGSSGGVD